MKKIIILALLIICSSSTFCQEDPAILHIYRPGQFNASLVNFTIYVNDEAYCKLSNNKRISLEVPPGELKIVARQSGVELMKKTIYFEITAESGQDIYLKGDVKSSFTRYRMELSRVFPEQFEKDVKKKKIKPDNCQETLEEK